MLDQDAPKPSYPFVGYKFTTINIPESGLPIEETELVQSSEQQFEYDIAQKLITMPTMTLSITSYSDNIDESHSLALRAYEWFFHVGYEHLSDLGIVVTSTGNVDDRSVLIEVYREYRMGFDVTLRFTNDSQIIQPTIEEVEYLELAESKKKE